MKALVTIEKSAFHRGEYVGYCKGVQRIVREDSAWRTAGLRSADGLELVVSARTLAELDTKLQRIANS